MTQDSRQGEAASRDMVGHDIKNSLGVILMRVQYLSYCEGQPDREALESVVRGVESEVTRIRTILDEAGM